MLQTKFKIMASSGVVGKWINTEGDTQGVYLYRSYTTCKIFSLIFTVIYLSLTSMHGSTWQELICILAGLLPWILKGIVYRK